MISIIICSKSKALAEKVSGNIDQTIGVPYQLIIIDNTKANLSIYEAYNNGSTKAKHEIIVFVHEDVVFHTNGWGNILHQCFSNIPDVGCIGVGGAVYKSKAPGGWWHTPQSEWALYILQHFKDKSVRLEDIGWQKELYWKEVAVIDGVFMAVRKGLNVVLREEIGGFHGYDLDLSFQVRMKGFKLFVTKEILVEHFSIGTINEGWVKSVHQLHKLYKDELPIYLQGDINKSYEIESLQKFILNALDLRLRSIAWLNWMLFLKLNPFSKFNLRFIYLFLRKFTS